MRVGRQTVYLFVSTVGTTITAARFPLLCLVILCICWTEQRNRHSKSGRSKLFSVGDNPELFSSFSLAHIRLDSPHEMRPTSLALAAAAAITACFPSLSLAIFAEDAGSLDFQVSTTGHGVSKFSHVIDGSLLITSDAGSFSPASSSCYVACRELNMGDLLWRRRVCSSGKSISHALAVGTAGGVYTVDSFGVARGWAAADGSLMWEVRVVESPMLANPRVWSITNKRGESIVFAAVSEVNDSGSDVNDHLVVINADTGAVIDRKDALDALDHSFLKPKKGEEPRWLHFLPQPTRVGAIESMIGFVKEGDGGLKEAVGSRMAVLELDVNVAHNLFTMGQNRHLNFVKSPILAASICAVDMKEDAFILALSSDQTKLVSFSVESSSVKELSSKAVKDDWTALSSIQLQTAVSSAVAVVGDDGTTALIDPANVEVITNVGTASASCSVDSGKIWTISLGSDSPLIQLSVDQKQIDISEGPTGTAPYLYGFESIEHMKILNCDDRSGSVLISTRSGTTSKLDFNVSENSAKFARSWTSEEGLANISSAIILDASHGGDASDGSAYDDVQLAGMLSLTSRLQSQWKDISNTFSQIFGLGSSADFSRRDFLFGFVKVAVMLSQSSHRVWGMETAGKHRGSIRWVLDLPEDADQHAIVHGTANSPKAVHGIHGGTHGHEMLVLSTFSAEGKSSWSCVDGTTGVVHASGSVSLTSPIVQVLPIHGGASGASCRQMAAFLHEDESVSVVPDDKASRTILKQQLKSTPNGMFAHRFDKIANKIETFHLSAMDDEASTLSTQLIGRTIFPNERIVNVAYPSRDEVVQSMCTVLGDDSLLLKYINPHLSVVMTTSDYDDEEIADGKLTEALSRKLQGNQRKPKGVTDISSEEDEPVYQKPNLFVNVVDTVSGRLLHRASHANADLSGPVAAVITENWIVYSFMNKKTRRAELGVLTLHEGMIDKKGLTAFASPEQTTSFSSLDPTESKPVVLSKTYTFPKAISALGATSTRGGISNRKILVASSDGRISAIDRKMLETRRPLSQLKEAEKAEGLYQYTELIPSVPLMALTHNRTVESVQSVISTYTSLESQSLVFAFGGPDLFFARVSPSRGFDLLPDSFSRVLVSIVVVALMAILFTAQRMSKKKAVKEGWL